MKIPQNFRKIPQNLMKKSQRFMKKVTKIHLSWFLPTSYQRRRNMGHFKNPVSCAVGVTWGKKIQI